MAYSHSSCSYRRVDTEARGRHLVANRRINKNELIFCERPLCALQSVGNVHQGALVCRACRAFCGGPTLGLKLASGRLARHNVLEESASSSTSSLDRLVPCRQNCGEIYCSADCEADFWPSHSFLCTGPIENEDHPLLEWKRHAIENNEIFLLVGDVLTAILAHPELKEKYMDFTMVPWWNVVTLSLANDPMGFAEASVLDKSCRTLCEESANLLNAALKLQGEVDMTNNLITPLFIAQIIGSFEQNAIGIRSRHPLCRDILENEGLRNKQLGDVIQCLERAGFIGEGGDNDPCCDESEDDMDGDDIANNDVEKMEGDEAIADEDIETIDDINEMEQDENRPEEWDYSTDEIAEFIAGLDIDDRAPDDDLNALFTPLDGTAMFSMTCKMNHSCNPNVMVIYRGLQWNEPLVAHVVGLRDIEEGEEMCISYIDVNQSYDVRQRELANYGFVCTCQRCLQEEQGDDAMKSGAKVEMDEDELFGGEEDADMDEEQEDDTIELDDDPKGQNALHEKLETIKAANDSAFCAALPISICAEAQNFVLQQGTMLLRALDQGCDIAKKLIACVSLTKLRRFAGCTDSGSELEQLLYKLLQENGSWPNDVFRGVYWVSTVVASVGLAHDGRFLHAQSLLDKSMVLGFDRLLIQHFFDHIEHHANCQYQGTLVARSISCEVSELRSYEIFREYGLSKNIEFPAPETASNVSANMFEEQYVKQGLPVVLRGVARDWPAISRWRSLSMLARKHGHRQVPIEIGSMLSRNGMEEKLMSLRSFVSDYLVSSCNHGIWSLDDALKLPSAYLAQHVLLDQIPELLEDVDISPALCGPQGPSRRNVWIGTGGTRTPLHFDSFENMFVQIVGAKYVRIYANNQTPNLYVSKEGAYAVQGNMSAVDCECEDFELHKLAKDASYEEVLLLPGDCLFVPSGMWHYVRSLSTSVSVNYWW